MADLNGVCPNEQGPKTGTGICAKIKNSKFGRGVRCGLNNAGFIIEPKDNNEILLEEKKNLEARLVEINKELK